MKDLVAIPIKEWLLLYWVYTRTFWCNVAIPIKEWLLLDRMKKFYFRSE